MNIDQWIHEVSKAYQTFGMQFSSNKKALLFEELSESSTQAQKEIVSETIEVMSRFFFKKASQGETFGSLSRVEERFGQSIEENYGMQSGPFIDLAKSYWTYKVEVGDLFPDHHSLALSQALLGVENDIASVFFPTPGPMQIPVHQRRETQRQLLQEYAPEIDIERFLSDNPMLKAEERRGGWFGIVLLIILIPVGFLIAGYLLSS